MSDELIPRARTKKRRVQNPRGQMQPFTRDDVDHIRRSLFLKKDYRQLALMSVGIDSLLRASDLLKLKVSDVRSHSGEYIRTFRCHQKKTDQKVTAYLSEDTTRYLKLMVEESGKFQTDYLFTKETDPHGKPISSMSLRRYVKIWAKMVHKDPYKFAAHSLRRSRPAFIYAETKNVRACQKLLGHRNLGATSEYLGVEDKDVEEIAMKYEF
jgi:integrase